MNNLSIYDLIIGVISIFVGIYTIVVISKKQTPKDKRFFQIVVGPGLIIIGILCIARPFILNWLLR